MTRRTLWTVLVCVIGLLVLASQAPTLVTRHHADSAANAIVRPLAAWRPFLLSDPVIVAAAIGFLGLVMLGWWWQRRVRRRRAVASDDPTPFATVLDQALDRRRPVPSPRQQMVTALAHRGQGVAEIARATRLSQDAVRSLIATLADSDRHELPPHPDSGGGHT